MPDSGPVAGLVVLGCLNFTLEVMSEDGYLTCHYFSCVWGILTGCKLFGVVDLLNSFVFCGMVRIDPKRPSIFGLEFPVWYQELFPYFLLF